MNDQIDRDELRDQSLNNDPTDEPNQLLINRLRQLDTPDWTMPEAADVIERQDAVIAAAKELRRMCAITFEDFSDCFTFAKALTAFDAAVVRHLEGDSDAR